MAFVPSDPYQELSEEQHEHFESLPGYDYIPAEEMRDVEYMYAVGFGFTSIEYDQMGLDPETVTAMRERFFDYMRMEWDQFDWSGWREALGYEEG